MSTKVAYIITEGKVDAELIKRLLPDLTNKPDSIGILMADGYSSALSITQSVLLQAQRPTLLVIDADTNDEMRIREKKTFIEQYVRVNGMTCRVELAVPTLEVLFFTDKTALEAAIGKAISDDVWTLAKLSPEQALELLTGQSSAVAGLRLLENEVLRQKIGQTQLMNDIKSFIQTAQMPVSV